MMTARVGAAPARGDDVVAPARGVNAGVIGAFGFAATGAAVGLSAAIALGAVGTVGRGGGVGDFFYDAAERARGFARALSPANLFAGRGARRRAALAYDGGARDGYADDVDDYDGRGRGGGGYDPRGRAGGRFTAGASEAPGLDAQYHTARTRNLMAGATSTNVVANESRDDANPRRRLDDRAAAARERKRRSRAWICSDDNKSSSTRPSTRLKSPSVSAHRLVRW